MKKELGLIVIIIAVFVGVSATLSFAQQKQATPDRAAVERGEMKERQPAPPGDFLFEFNRGVQGPDGPPPPGMPGDFVFIANEMSFGGKVVKGAPYSAQAVTESVQTLSDGNRIVNKSTSAIYRDSEGRTRREQTLKAIGSFANSGEVPQTIFISDPVAGTSYTLNPRTHTAHKMPPMNFTFQFKTPPPAGDKAGAMPELQVVERGGTGQRAGDKAGSMPELHVVERGGTAQVQVLPPESADRVTREGQFIWGWGNHVANNESLGKQNIEGVEVEGTRSTTTIPAGEIGNERSIEIVNERWYSAELQTVVMTRHSDPRFGESSYRLTNIDRSEPVKSLFEVPADYTLTQGARGHGEGIGGGVGFAAGGIATYRPSDVITGGVLNGKATSLPIPAYPSIAKAARAGGNVTVEVTVDEEGNVVTARAVSGHPLLQAASVEAARNAKFSPTKLSGQAVKVQGVLVYTFSGETVQSPKDSN
ncbi:MAG TPA: energy transducer TonB [Pyrinomonadaceae bacterium]|nr:energy transducer TonB [Pyrinomonadaceae bacterium]